MGAVITRRNKVRYGTGTFKLISEVNSKLSKMGSLQFLENDSTRPVLGEKEKGKEKKG